MDSAESDQHCPKGWWGTKRPPPEEPLANFGLSDLLVVFLRAPSYGLVGDD